MISNKIEFRIALGLIALSTFPALRGAEGDVTVDVIAEVTHAGKKIERPTLQHPAYYLPLPTGYKTGGQPAFWQRPSPAPAEMVHMLAKALAGQGYLIMTHEHHPSLTLMFGWGYIAPLLDMHGYQLYIARRPPIPTTVPIDRILNGAAMMEMTGGNRFKDIWSASPNAPYLKEAVAAAGVPRYYIVIRALDFSDWLHHKETLLWIARISCPYWGSYLDEALPVLIKNGAPLFGTNMTEPQMIKTSIIPEGRVEAGAPMFKGYQTPISPRS